MLSMNLPRQSTCRTWISTFLLLVPEITGCGESVASRNESRDGVASIETDERDAPRTDTQRETAIEPAFQIPGDDS